jgi:hypothetical protein
VKQFLHGPVQEVNVMMKQSTFAKVLVIVLVIALVVPMFFYFQP